MTHVECPWIIIATRSHRQRSNRAPLRTIIIWSCCTGHGNPTVHVLKVQRASGEDALAAVSSDEWGIVCCLGKTQVDNGCEVGRSRCVVENPQAVADSNGGRPNRTSDSSCDQEGQLPAKG
jgi:hypothetical protein